MNLHNKPNAAVEITHSLLRRVSIAEDAATSVVGLRKFVPTGFGQAGHQRNALEQIHL
jgi:hypothetical protein